MLKPAGMSLALLLASHPAGLRAADAPATGSAAAAATAEKPAPTDRLSDEAAQKLTALLPKFNPGEPPKPAPAPNPDVLELPKVTVRHKPRPRLGDIVMMTPTAFNEKLAKEKLTPLDRDFLNKFTLPSWFGGTSAADRAREDYNREMKAQLMGEVSDISRAVDAVDPAQAKALRDAAARP